MTKLFFIGATGHIGNAVLNAIYIRFPDLEIVALVRDDRKASQVSKCYKNVTTIVGDFRDLASIESESKSSAIIINTAPDQSPGSDDAIRAALSGLGSSPAKGFYIQTSGAFLIGEDAAGGASPQKIWSDVADIDLITALPSTRYHKQTDQIVRDSSHAVNVSIVSPTVVYGLSVGQRVPITVRDIVATVKQLSMGFTMGDGRNIMGYIHVDDLADIYVRLVADAIKEPAERDSRLWGQQAYYFATGEEMSFAAYMKSLVELLEMKSMIKSKVVKDFRVVGSAEERELVANVAETHGCGMSVRCRSERAETLLSWKVHGPSFLDTLPEVLGVL